MTKLSTFVADQTDTLFSEKKKEISYIVTEVKKAIEKPNDKNLVFQASPYSLLNQTTYSYEGGVEKQHILTKLDVYQILTKTKFVTGFTPVKASTSTNGNTNGATSTTSTTSTTTVTVNGQTFENSSTAATSEFARLYSGPADRFAWYGTKTSSSYNGAVLAWYDPVNNPTAGLNAIQQATSKTSPFQLFMNPFSGSDTVWWSYKETPERISVPESWVGYTGLKENGKFSDKVSAAWLTESQDIFRKMQPSEYENKQISNTATTSTVFVALHSQYPVQYGASQPLYGFKNQFTPANVASGLQFQIPGYTTLPNEFRIFVPPGVGLFSVTANFPQNTKFAVAIRMSTPPDSNTSLQAEEYETARARFDPENVLTKLLAGEEIIAVHNYGGNMTLTGNLRFLTQLGERNKNGFWLYYRILNGEKLYLLGGIGDNIDNTQYTTWYNSQTWDTFGNPVETTLNSTTEDSDQFEIKLSNGKVIRGDHEVIRLSPWDGKTTVRLQQALATPTLPASVYNVISGLNTSFLPIWYIPKESENLYSTLPWISTDSEKHSISNKTAYWAQVLPKHLPVLKQFNPDTYAIRYFVLVHFSDSSIRDEYQTNKYRYVFPVTEKQATNAETQTTWITPRKTTEITLPTDAGNQSNAFVSNNAFNNKTFTMFVEITEEIFNRDKFVSAHYPKVLYFK